MSLAPDDPRWNATLEYTNDDDGIWLCVGLVNRNLGFWPSVRDVLEAAADLPPVEEHPE